MSDHERFDAIIHLIEVVLAGGIFLFTALIARQVRKQQAARLAAAKDAEPAART